MCGIAGSVNTNDAVLDTMLESLAHRGPDDVGTYRDGSRGVSLGQRRLAIIDLSSAGHQPMSDADENIWVTYNGEIYNYRLLADELRSHGHVFRSNSDTEVLIHGYKEYGADIFKKIEGMWAAALYDKKGGKLILSRDPAGIKPLYLYQSKNQFLFASEIGALQAAVGSQALEIDPRAAARFFAHGYIYGEETIYREIKSIPRATTEVIDVASMHRSHVQSYTHDAPPAPRDLDEAVEQFDSIFSDSVKGSLQADVPVGIFLSGGIDSSLVAYYARENGATLQTFTIGFSEKDFDESKTASRIAAHFGFPSSVAMMTGRDAAEHIDDILGAFGQPFADTSAIPTYFLSKLARESGYKVVLTGDGADELFGGYPTHYLPMISHWYQKTPRFVDALLQSVAGSMPDRFTKLGMKEKMLRFLAGARDVPAIAHARWKRVFSDSDMTRLLKADFLDTYTPQDISFEALFRHARDSSGHVSEAAARTDFDTFLTWDCLVKSDISAMQNAIEGRVPFLNKPVIDFAWNLPAHMKTRPFKTKILLRRVLKEKGGHVFSDLPKQGFVPPLSRWLCAELKSVMLNTLSEEHVARTGMMRYDYIQTLIREHLAMTHDHSKKLWSLMSFVHFYIYARN